MRVCGNRSRAAVLDSITEKSHERCARPWINDQKKSKKRCDIEERFTLYKEIFSDWRRVREIGYRIRFASRRYFFAVIMYFSQASTESRKSSLGSWGREQGDGGAERGFQGNFFL